MSDIVRINEFVERSEGGLRTALLHADTLRQELAERGDWNQLLYAIEGLRTLKADLDILLRSCEDDAARLLPEKKVVVDGIGMVERRTTSSRKWDSEPLLKDLCRMILDPGGTGEITAASVAQLMKVLKEVLPMTASLGWRVTALKAIGIDPEQYSETTYGRQTIQIVK
jgi:hypothetical protein